MLMPSDYRATIAPFVVAFAFLAGTGARAHATETFDIIFVIDGSGSISSSADGPFTLQKEGIANCLLGDRAFIPLDGTCAIAIIQLGTGDSIQIGGNTYTGVTLHVPLTTINGLGDAQAIVDLLTSTNPPGIAKGDGGSPLDQALGATCDILRNHADGSQHFVVVSTDGEPDDMEAALTVANEIRAGDPDPNYRPQGKICSVLVGQACYEQFPWDTPNCFLRRLANTNDSANNCAQPPAGREHPDQPEGKFSCATDSSDYPPLLDSYVEDFVMLCSECACAMIHAGEGDCNGNNVPDICESGDCQPNGIPDVCDLPPYGSSDDCNFNGIPDECEPDCQPNGVADDCDIAAGTSHDWNYDGIPDECQILGAAIYVDEDALLSPHDGSDWDHAYLTLQEGLADARANPQKVFIFVANGTYEPDEGTGEPGNRSKAFDLVNGLAIMGGFAGSGAVDPFERQPQDLEPLGHASVLSGDLLGNDQPGFVNNADNSYHVVTAGNTVTSSTILDGFFIVGGNADGYEGGGGFRMSGANPRVFNCTITANSALNNGGGIAVENGSPELANFIVARNRTTNSYSMGSGIYCDGISQASIVNCTIVCNTSWNSAGAVADYAVLTNSILWGNTPAQIQTQYGSLPTVSYCTIQGGWPGTRILRSDPAFVDPDGPDDNPDTWQDNDYHLSSVSPCIDVGANGVSRRPLQDIDLQNRVQECVVDMGADETPYFYDCNSNGQHDGCEVLADPSIDCNSNGRPDTCDIADGISSDCDQSGVPDECESNADSFFDFDGDCDVDQSDFNHAQECWTGGSISLDCQDVYVTWKD